MRLTVADIARSLGAAFDGDGDLPITGAAEPAMAGPTDLAMAMSPAYAERLPQGRALAALLWVGADYTALGLKAAIFAPRPRMAMAGLTAALDPGPVMAPGVHPTAIIDPSAQIGPDAAIGPYAVIGPQSTIGPRCRIGAQVSIGAHVRIGADALILPGVVIGDGVTAGDRLIIQPGAAIAGDGFSFVTAEKSRVEDVRETLGTPPQTAATPQSWVRIHSLGSVTLGDDVEIGANSSIDRGTIRDTVIGSGTKIDSLVQVGHNVIVGRDCLLCAQAGVAGSSILGDRVVLGGKVGVADNLKIGDDVVAGGGSVILSNVPSGRSVMGNPAVRMDQNIEMYKAQRRLPRLLTQVAALQKALLAKE